MWGIPYSDRYWETLHSLQWQVFAYHVAEDRKEEEELLRDIAEYAMAFHNFEAVQAVRDKREQQAYLDDQQSQDIFAKQVEQLFGRKLTEEEMAAMNMVPQNSKEEENLDDIKIVR